MVIQITGEQEILLQQIASHSGKASEAIVADVITAWLNEQVELAAELDQARADLAAGRVLTSEQVWQRIEGRIRAA